MEPRHLKLVGFRNSRRPSSTRIRIRYSLRCNPYSRVCNKSPLASVHAGSNSEFVVEGLALVDVTALRCYNEYLCSWLHFCSLQRFNMALPIVKAIAECADFSKTVLPYTFQLYDLPLQVFQSISNPQALKVLYVSTNPLISAFALSLFLAPIFLVVSEINKNYSWVDRFWSILPTIYNAHFALYAHAVGLPTQRLDTLLAFSAVWSVRPALIQAFST